MAPAAAGAYISAKTLFADHPLDPDMADPAMLWYGLHRHGLTFLTHWQYTPDNWLFSLAPLHFLLFWLFGPRPILVFLLGWLMFLAGLLMLGLIAWRIGSRISAMLVPVVLLFCGEYAQLYGMVSYPVSHGVTLFWGLLGFWAALGWLERNRRADLVVLFAATLIGGLSDPWLLAAFGFPLILACAMAWWIDQDDIHRRRLIRLLSVQVVAVIGVKTRLFGLCHFLTGYSFRFGDWPVIRANAGFFIRDLGGLFSFASVTDQTALTPALVSLGALVGFGIIALAIGVRDLPRSDPAILVFFMGGLLSVAGVSVPFILGVAPAGIYSGRYLINILFLAPLLISVAFERARRPPKLIIAAWSAAACLFIAAGLISNAAAWRRPGFQMRANGIPAMVAFLRRHHLGTGYGSYWGTNANAASWYAALHHEGVRVRPVVFSAAGTMIIGTRAESSSLWADDFSQPRSGAGYFVMLGNGGVQCPDIHVCVQGLSAQYGLPARRIAWRRGLILVWAHPLADWTTTQK